MIYHNLSATVEDPATGEIWTVSLKAASFDGDRPSSYDVSLVKEQTRSEERSRGPFEPITYRIHNQEGAYNALGQAVSLVPHI